MSATVTREVALERLRAGNRIRFARAAHRREVEDLPRVKGEAAVAGLLVDPPRWLCTARVVAVLAWPRSRGRKWAMEVVLRAGLSPETRVADLREEHLYALLPLIATGPGPWTRERVLGLVRYRYERDGRSPTRNEIESALRARKGSLVPMFGGTWNDVLSVAGVPQRAKADPAEYVPTAFLRDVYGRSGMTLSELASALGWESPRKDRPKARRLDTTRVRRVLGMARESTKSGRRVYRRSVSPDLAERMVRAMGFDPVDVGL